MLQNKMENQPMYNVTIGMDLGDKKHQIHLLDKNGKTIKVCQVSNTAKAMKICRRAPDMKVRA